MQGVTTKSILRLRGVGAMVLGLAGPALAVDHHCRTAEAPIAADSAANDRDDGISPTGIADRGQIRPFRIDGAAHGVQAQDIRGIATERKFREDQHIGTAGAGPVEQAGVFGNVSGHIAAHGVELRRREP